MGYTVEPGRVLRKRLQTGRQGINAIETHAFEITDIEFFVLAHWLRAERAGHQTLADRIARVGLDWEHFLALQPASPSERTPETVTELDRLAAETEILAAEIDVRTGVVGPDGRPFPPVREERGGER